MRHSLSEVLFLTCGAMLGAGSTVPGFWGGAAFGTLLVLWALTLAYLWQDFRR